MTSQLSFNLFQYGINTNFSNILLVIQNHQREPTKNAHAKTVSSLIQTQQYATFSSTVSTVMLLKLNVHQDSTSMNTKEHATGQKVLDVKDAKQPKVSCLSCLLSFGNCLKYVYIKTCFRIGQPRRRYFPLPKLKHQIQ